MAAPDHVPPTFAVLKEKQRRLREEFHPNLGLRIHRSLSWLQRAEMAGDDLDARFIFLWIAFNAAYAAGNPDITGMSERSVFDGFFARILELDKGQIIYTAIWKKFSGPIKSLLDNRYIYQPFWNHQNKLNGFFDWEDRFNKSRKRISEALVIKDTRLILTTLFDRLYVLRNQIIHGGATWNSAINRVQINDGARILGFILPVIFEIMMDDRSVVWGQPNFPVIEG